MPVEYRLVQTAPIEPAVSAPHPYRLPRVVVPSHYRLTIEPDLSGGTFRGSVEIDAEVREPTRTILCNSLDLDIATANVTSGGRQSRATVSVIADDERIAIELATELTAGPITISMTFSGAFNEQLVGFYASTFQADGHDHVMGVTQFEAPHARRAFPCWDEPEFKATFDISIVCDASMVAISNEAERARTNLDDGRVRFDFDRTMPMSTYLVAWVIGDLTVTEGAARSASGTPVRLVHRPGQEHLTSFALDCAVHALDWFEQYYGIAYPASKLDLVAVPDFAFGAMENLGCVTFRESLLLLDADRVSRSEIERAATVIEHEIAHMWFGDLVTMKWWNGIWLNEAFATFMEMSCGDAYRPDWHVWTSFGMSKVQAFDTDALASTRPIEYEVHGPADAEGMFDILTYEKGAAVLRMIEQWIGPDAFRDGVRAYLDEFRYSNTDTADLWAALARGTGQPVGEIMDSWILQGGHPLVTVDLAGSRMKLSQQRFTFHGGDATDEPRWSIPLRVRASVAGETVEHHVLLSDTTMDLELGGEPEWVDANPDATGFFRTHYAGGAIEAHNRRLPAMEAVERFALLDDAWAALLNSSGELAPVVATIRGIAATETDASIWRRIGSAMGSLRLLGGGDHAPAVARLTRDLIGDRLTALTERIDHADLDHEAPDQASDDDRDLRGILFRLAGVVGDDGDVAAQATRWFSELLADPTSLDGSLTTAVLEVVAAQGGTAEFDQIVDLYRTATTPQDELRALGALACFDEVEPARRLCAMSLDEIRSQNAPFTLAQAMGNPGVGIDYWRFVTEHWDAMNERFPSSSIVRMVGGVRSFFDAEAVSSVQRFFDDQDIPQGRMSLSQHLERTRVNVALRARVLDEFGAALTGA